MITIKLSTEFSVDIRNDIFRLSLKFPNELGNVSISYEKDLKGNYHLYNISLYNRLDQEPTESSNWNCTSKFIDMSRAECEKYFNNRTSLMARTLGELNMIVGHDDIIYDKRKYFDEVVIKAKEANKDVIWDPLDAGIASICKFLDRQLTDETKIIIKEVVRNERTNKETETETIENLNAQKVEIKFSKLLSKDVPTKVVPIEVAPKELTNAAMKIYLLEKMLKGMSGDDIKQIGLNKLIPSRIELRYIKNRKIVFDEKKEKEFSRSAGNEFDHPIFYSANFLKRDKIRVFFQSGIEENEKIIKVLYCLGSDCNETKQRIRKIKLQNTLFDNGTVISYCSDWEVCTIGKDEIIRDFAAQVANNLAIFLDVSEQFIREQKFDVLWDMCKTSS